jgi:ABC-type cobalt transport system substrate-binding protein
MLLSVIVLCIIILLAVFTVSLFSDTDKSGSDTYNRQCCQTPTTVLPDTYKSHCLMYHHPAGRVHGLALLRHRQIRLRHLQQTVLPDTNYSVARHLQKSLSYVSSSCWPCSRARSSLTQTNPAQTPTTDSVARHQLQCCQTPTKVIVLCIIILLAVFTVSLFSDTDRSGSDTYNRHCCQIPTVNSVARHQLRSVLPDTYNSQCCQTPTIVGVAKQLQ